MTVVAYFEAGEGLDGAWGDTRGPGAVEIREEAGDEA
jgi:hypothetical protein